MYYHYTQPLHQAFQCLLGYEAELLSNNINLSIKSRLIRSKIDVKNDSSFFLIRRFRTVRSNLNSAAAVELNSTLHQLEAWLT